MNINLTLLMQAAAFAAFIWFTAKFIWPPLVVNLKTSRSSFLPIKPARLTLELEMGSAEAVEIVLPKSSAT